MNEVEEYRKASAEKLGIILHNDNLHIRYIPNELLNSCEYYQPELGSQWNPHAKADQREMIEDWLIKQGCVLESEYCTTDKTWLCHIIMKSHYMSQGEDKSKSIAFMEAFMEYIKQK